MSIKKLNSYLSLGLLLIVSGCATSQLRILNIADQLNAEASKPEYDLSIVTVLAGGLKKEDFSDRTLKRYSDAELVRFYAALANATFLIPEDENLVTIQENIFREKSARSTPPKSDIEDMYSAYLEARLFDKAAALKKQYPGTKFYSMPEKIISNNASGAIAWRIYTVSDEGKTIQLTALSLEQGPKVVMLMLPGCGVAEEAMKQILADSGLEPVFRQYGAVMTKRMNAESVSLWKSHFSFPEVYLAYKTSDFPGFDFSASPNIYFLSGGKVISHITGWSKDWRQKMAKGFESISVALPTTSPSASTNP